MRYADQHIHCDCSQDCDTPLADMAAAGARAGLSLLCFTDHLDMAGDRDGRATPEALEEKRARFLARRAAYERAPEPGIALRFGMELGEPAQAPEVAGRAAALPGLDLVIASVHNLPDREDFYWMRYESERQCAALNWQYLSALLDTAGLACFDVMGHIGYTCRYMQRQGFSERITAARYGEELTAILRRLIEGGRGIECNASGYRERGGFPYPDGDVLRLYRALGGEIVTVGSDSHTVDMAENGRIADAYELLRACGFRAVCEFRERRCEFMDLK